MPFWCANVCQPFQTGPLFDRLAAAIQKLPAQSASKAEAGVVGGAAANADQTARCPSINSCSEKSSQAKSIQCEWMELFRRQHRQADHLRGFDDCGLMFPCPPPLR